MYVAKYRSMVVRGSGSLYLDRDPPLDELAHYHQVLATVFYRFMNWPAEVYVLFLLFWSVFALDRRWLVSE